jgi:SAM-dependent methyltransferase
MSERLFDAAGARKLEALYLTPDVVAQRERVLAALAPQPGERIADLGCGPGLLARDILERTGGGARVEGIDLSDSMIALARERCAGLPSARFQGGDVAALPYADASFDAAVCTQVYEYVEDVDRALAELRRVLRPGARAIVVDSDWESCVWHCADAARMRRMLETWDTHCPHPQLPRTLAARLRAAGLAVQSCEVVGLVNLVGDAQTYSHGMLRVIARHARGRVDEATLAAWVADLEARAAAGDYFFSLNRYLFRAARPA